MKKRALIEKEKLVYAPFSGVGGIVYDKDAVYVELGGSHSHKQREDDELENIVSNLTEVKETIDEKMKYSGLQLFTGGQELTAEDLDNNISQTNSVILHEKEEKPTSDDLIDELKQLRNTYEEVNDAGRIRRKVIFNTPDNGINTNHSEKDIESDEQNESSDNRNEENIKALNLSNYTNLSVNKDKDVHSKINSILSSLENKKKETIKKINIENMEDDDSNDDNTESDNKELESEYDETDSEDEESLSEKVSNGNKHESKDLINKSNPTESSDDSDDEFLQLERKDTLTEQFQQPFLDEREDLSDDSNDEAIQLKWKDNLAEKAQQSFLDRQSTNKSLMKLVYGMHVFYQFMYF